MDQMLMMRKKSKNVVRLVVKKKRDNVVDRVKCGQKLERGGKRWEVA